MNLVQRNLDSKTGTPAAAARQRKVRIMSRLQTRRSISVSHDVYRRLETFARGVPISQIATAGIEAVMRGDVKLEEMEATEAPRADNGRFRALRRAAEVAAQVRADTAQMARAAVERGLSPTVAIPVSERLCDDIVVQARRDNTTPEMALDHAVTRMLDSMDGGGWCRTCVEAIEHCGCPVRQTGRTS